MDIPHIVIALLVALFGWWFSTGVILYLNLLPRPSHRWSILGFTAIAALALALLPRVNQTASEAGALYGFVIALIVWGWLEISYLMGFITGTNKQPCPGSATGWRRFRLAVATSIHHEMAVAVGGIIIVLSSWNAANQVAMGTYLTLWFMRWSAKLNLYLGVANFNEHWLPERNRYLVTYMRTRAMNFLFPLSVGVGTALATLLCLASLNAADPFHRLGYMLVCTLLSLAVLEHWFLVLPIRDSALWQWAISAADRARSGRTTPRSAAAEADTVADAGDRRNTAPRPLTANPLTVGAGSAGQS